MLSTWDLSMMPSIDDLRVHMQRLAAITAVFSVEMGEPPFVFEPRWRKHRQVAMSINGCGDELFIHFLGRGCFVKGFAHESEMTPCKREDHSLWPGVIDAVPREFAASLKEPAFGPTATTFVIWRLATDDAWYTGAVEYPPGDYRDGSSDLMEPISFDASQFADWLSENYETEVDLGVVQSVWAGEALTDNMMRTLNASSPLHALRDAVRKTGYPVNA